MSFKHKLSKSGTALVVSLLFFVTNAIAQQTAIKTGMWQGALQLNDSISLPFNFEIKNLNGVLSMEIINAEERILVNEIMFKADSLIIQLPVFDSEFRCKISEDVWKGVWINHSRKDKNIIPFNASHCLNDCESKEVFASNHYFSLEGKWECDFSPYTKNVSKAVALIKQTDPFKYISGTFLTETGDYRYLEGRVKYNRAFYLACFDGAHAFLFKGNVKGDSIVNGHFYSGAHHQEPWVAVRNEKFELRNPDSLTYLKTGYSKIDFSFSNLEGKTISLSDPKYKGKVVIVQLMGSWCPNCMDETKFLASFYDQYETKGLEVIGLAFERTDDFNKAAQNITRLKNRFSANYDFLITMKTGKDQASAALPMLNAVMAFPTTIYIDKKGIVRKIYTGFNGPATGTAYTKFVEETTLFVEKLLQE